LQSERAAKRVKKGILYYSLDIYDIKNKNFIPTVGSIFGFPFSNSLSQRGGSEGEGGGFVSPETGMTEADFIRSAFKNILNGGEGFERQDDL
jgi:hypothetical protein